MSEVVETEYGFHVIKLEGVLKDADAEAAGRAQIATARYRAVEGEAKASDLQCISGGDTGAKLAEDEYGALVHEIDNSKMNSTSKAKAFAKAELQRRANTFLTGSVQCTGIPDAVSGAKLTIEGAGWPLSGDFVIKETTHTLEPGSGYRTTISFYSDSLPPEA
jgi:phage protein D